MCEVESPLIHVPVQSWEELSHIEREPIPSNLNSIPMQDTQVKASPAESTSILVAELHVSLQNLLLLFLLLSCMSLLLHYRSL